MLSLNSHYKTLDVYAEPQYKQSELTYLQLGKRIFDICSAVLATVLVLSWLIPTIGLLIKLGSAGPVLYIQKRTGYRGRAFNCFKFRTMTYNPTATFKQATRNDSRVTPIGRFLRKTNLDEMPQFINVLIGDMSIVGPRPHPLELDAKHWDILPKYRSRYRTKPGITGLAQVRGCRGETDELMKMAHRVRYDRFYNRKKSPLLDIWICWQTISTMLKGNVNAW